MSSSSMLFLVVMVILSLEQVIHGQDTPKFIKAICEDKNQQVSIKGIYRLPGDSWTHILTSPTTGYSLKDLKYNPGAKSGTKLDFSSVKEYDVNIQYLRALPSDAKPVIVTLTDIEPGDNFTYFWSPQSMLHAAHVDKAGKETAISTRLQEHDYQTDPGGFYNFLKGFHTKNVNSTFGELYDQQIWAMTALPREWISYLPHQQRAFVFYKRDKGVVSEMHVMVGSAKLVPNPMPHKEWIWAHDVKIEVVNEWNLVDAVMVLKADVEKEGDNIRYNLKMLLFFDGVPDARPEWKGRFRVENVTVRIESHSGLFKLLNRHELKTGAVRDLFCNGPLPSVLPDRSTASGGTTPVLNVTTEALPSKKKISLGLVLAAVALLTAWVCCLGCLAWLLMRNPKKKQPVPSESDERPHEVVTKSNESLKSVRSDLDEDLGESAEEEATPTTKSPALPAPTPVPSTPPAQPTPPKTPSPSPTPPTPPKSPAKDQEKDETGIALKEYAGDKFDVERSLPSESESVSLQSVQDGQKAPSHSKNAAIGSGGRRRASITISPPKRDFNLD